MISIEKYSHKMLNVWDDFVSNSNSYVNYIENLPLEFNVLEIQIMYGDINQDNNINKRIKRITIKYFQAQHLLMMY